MSPRAKRFKIGSIIYFEKDKADSVFLLKEGRVNLMYDDLQSGEKVVDLISKGEFFGVKSGLIKFPREETAKVISDSIVYEFSANEFESLISKNTNIILKMLKAFSNQLRKVGKQVQSLVSNKIETEPADDFFFIGEYYLKNKKYKQAITVYQRYSHYYPEGKFSALAQKRLNLSKGALDSYGEGGGPTPVLDGVEELNFNATTANTAMNNYKQNTGDNIDDVDEIEEINLLEDKEQASESSKIYYRGISFMRQNRYLDAFNAFKKILQEGTNDEKMLANFEIGKCLFYLNKLNESISHLSNHLSKYPNFPEKYEVVFFIGNAYSKLGDSEKAGKYFNTILSSVNENDKIYRKALKALKEIG